MFRWFILVMNMDIKKNKNIIISDVRSLFSFLDNKIKFVEEKISHIAVKSIDTLLLLSSVDVYIHVHEDILFNISR